MARRNHDSEPPPHSPMPQEEVPRILPCDLQAERLLLGLAMLDDDKYWPVVEGLSPEDFSLESHRRIFGRMKELRGGGEHVDRLTLADALSKAGLLESVGGLTALMDLDSGIPEVPHPESWVRIILQKSALRATIRAAQKAIDRCFLAEEDPSDILTAATVNFREIAALGTKDDDGRTPEQVMTGLPGGISAFLDPTMRLRGIPTGFHKLDDMTGGCLPGQVWIIGARPSQGKTALAMNIAEHIASAREDYEPRAGSIFSLETNAVSLLDRMVCGRARVDNRKFRLGYLSHDERRALQHAASWMQDAPLTIYDEFGLGHESIMKAMRRDKERHDIAYAVIDYLGLMGGKMENRNNEISKITRDLKMLSKELGITLFLLSQLSRAVDKRAGGTFKPMLSDLRDSGSIEQDADVILFPFREETYRRDRKDLEGKAELIIAKQKNGPIGVVDLLFLGKYTRFENPAEKEEAPPPDGQQRFEHDD